MNCIFRDKEWVGAIGVKGWRVGVNPWYIGTISKRRWGCDIHIYRGVTPTTIYEWQPWYVLCIEHCWCALVDLDRHLPVAYMAIMLQYLSNRTGLLLYARTDDQIHEIVFECVGFTTK